MTNVAISINGMTRKYSTRTIDSAGRIITSYYDQNSSSIQKQTVYDPITGETMYLIGGLTVNETATRNNSRI